MRRLVAAALLALALAGCSAPDNEDGFVQAIEGLHGDFDSAGEQNLLRLGHRSCDLLRDGFTFAETAIIIRDNANPHRVFGDIAVMAPPYLCPDVIE